MQRRSTRVPVPKRHFEDVSGFSPTKKRQKSTQVVLQPPKQEEARVGADASALATTQPTTPPPMPVRFEEFKIHWQEREPIELFIRFFDPQSLSVIVQSTNTRAVQVLARRAESSTAKPQYREWHSVSVGELLRWLGILLYMGLHTEKCRSDYWRSTSHELGRYMGKNRWEQIHRFLTINPDESVPSNAPIWTKLEPVNSIIRKNCQDATQPATWSSIDEGMVAFRGRCIHKVKMKNKPIDEGFKHWAHSTHGLTHDWLWHSNYHGTEECSEKGKNRQFDNVPEYGIILLTPTFQVSIRLAERLRVRDPHTKYTIFMDNLFLNVPIVHQLLNMGIGCTGTIRKSAAGLPIELLSKLTEKSSLQWGEHIAVLAGKALCFIWQDNNAVLGITTSFSMHREEDKVVRLRRRPKKTSTNAALIRPIFSDLVRKALPIPTVIDAYNHHMNGVDLANQLRASFTCHRPLEDRWWRPILYWLIDVCTVNSFLIWRTNRCEKEVRSRRLHRIFQELLVQSLLAFDVQLPLYDRLSDHTIERRKSFGYCAWGRKHPGQCQQGVNNDAGARVVLGEVVNEARGTFKRPRQVNSVCTRCNVYLCIKQQCYRHWHVYLYGRTN